ncbi:hypothetical protein JCM5350_005548 [Sporobolomyces pararoseus]
MDPLNLVGNSTSVTHDLPQSTSLTTSLPSTTHLYNDLEALPSDLDAISTTTIFAIVYVPSPSYAVSVGTAGTLTTLSGSAPTGKNSTLEGYAAGSEYSNYTFIGLATIAFSTILTLLVLVTAFSCILVQSARMKRALSDAENDGGSDPEMDSLFHGEKLEKRNARKGRKGGQRRSERDQLLIDQESNTMSATSPMVTLSLSKRQAENEVDSTSSDAAEEQKTESKLSKAESTKTNKTSSASTPTSSSLETASTATESATATSAAPPWASAHPGSMQGFTDEMTTIKVVGVSSDFTFACPKKGDTWQDVTLGTELQAKFAQGAGCYMEYVFTVGSTGTEAGIFGCFVTTPQWNATEWWDAAGPATVTDAYAGSCQMNGLGYGEHTVRLVNSPVNPKKVYFTGLRFTTNKTQVPWSNHQWDTCCPKVTWPNNKPPTIQIGGAAANGTIDELGTGTYLAGLSNGAALFLIISIVLVVMVGSILLAVMICKKRPAAVSSPRLRLSAVIASKPTNDRPNYRQRRRSPPPSVRRRRRPSPPPTESDESATDTSTDGSDIEKARREKKRRDSMMDEPTQASFSQRDDA